MRGFLRVKNNTIKSTIIHNHRGNMANKINNSPMPKTWDEYEVKARYLPCLVAVIPLSHFLIGVLGNTFFNNLIADTNWFLIISNIGFPLVMVLCLIQIQVVFSKNVIESGIFGQNGIHFPTTDMLLLTGEIISQEQKVLIRNDLSKSFGIAFPSKDDEITNPDNSRMLARDTVAFIRKKVGKGIMTYQYNIRYGFFGNLIGGIIWAMPGSIGCALLYAANKNWTGMIFFVMVILAYLLFFIFRKRILSSVALSYADSLLSEYLSLM
jgi:hypothetical protein